MGTAYPTALAEFVRVLLPFFLYLVRRYSVGLLLPFYPISFAVTVP